MEVRLEAMIEDPEFYLSLILLRTAAAQAATDGAIAQTLGEARPSELIIADGTAGRINGGSEADANRQLVAIQLQKVANDVSNILRTVKRLEGVIAVHSSETQVDDDGPAIS